MKTEKEVDIRKLHHHHHRLYSPGWALASAWGFVTIFFFLQGEVVSLMPNPPTWRARVSLFVWVITLDLSGIGGPTSSIGYYQHSSRDHMTTQAPPLRQSRDTWILGKLNVHNMPWGIPNKSITPRKLYKGFIFFFVKLQVRNRKYVFSEGLRYQGKLQCS